MNIGLIIGSCRSGTSILWDALAIHNKVVPIWEEHDIWENEYAKDYRFERLTKEQATKEVIDKVRSFFAKKQEEGYYMLAKNPMNVLRVPYVKEIFPEAKIIHIVRDGRDVACSLTAGINNNGWHFQRPPSWRLLAVEEHDGLLRCAKVWKETVEIVLEDLKYADHLQVKLEDLINKPKEVLFRCMAYLGLEKDPSVYAFAKLISNDAASGYQASWQSKWYLPHKSRIGRYKEDLDEDQIEQVNELLKPLLIKLRYWEE